jgi:hypothetical protein
MTERKCSFCGDTAKVNVNHIMVCNEHIVDAQLIGS